MFNDPDDKPFEMKSQEPQDIGDNTPVLVPSDEPVRSAASTPPAKISKGNTGI